MDEFLADIRAFVLHLDANERAMIGSAICKLWDNYVTVPGPDAPIKAALRPYLKESIDNFLTNKKATE